MLLLDTDFLVELSTHRWAGDRFLSMNVPVVSTERKAELVQRVYELFSPTAGTPDRIVVDHQQTAGSHCERPTQTLCI